MAIQYVGGVATGRTGNSNATTTQSLTGLTGGIASAPAEGDLVIVCCAVGSQGRNPAQAISGYSTLGTQLNPTAVTYDTSMQVSYKRMTSTPDTSITIPAQGNVADGQSWAIMVFRGVDATTPFDVSSVSATGTGTGRPNPAQITPSTSGAWIVCAAAAAASATTTAFTFPSDLSDDAVQGTGADTNDSRASMAYHDGWASGAYDPAAYTGGTTGANDSWAAWTMALRPSPPPTVTISPSSDTIGIGEYVELTGNASISGSPAAGLTGSATSSDTGVAVAYAGAVTRVTATGTLDGVTHSTPGGTSPSGATIRRYTEINADSGDKRVEFGTIFTGTAGGQRIIIAAEVLSSNRPAVGIWLTSSSDGASDAYKLNVSTGAVSVDTAEQATSSVRNATDLGGGWWQVLIETVIDTDIDGTMLLLIGLQDSTAADPTGYVGDGTSYLDLGTVNCYWTGGVTDSSGNLPVYVRGVAAGTSNVDITIDGVTSSDSAITVSNAQTLTATKVTDGDTFGSHTLVQGGGGAQTLTATLVADADTFGTHALRARTTLAAQRVVDADSWGNHALRAIARLSQQRIVDADTFGNAVLVQVAGSQTLVASRIVDADTFGNASLRARITLPATLYANTSTHGNAALRARYTLGQQRIVDGDTFGNAVLRARTTLVAQRVADGDTFGNASLRALSRLAQQTVVNAQTFGNATLLVGDGKQYLQATRISDADTWGNASLRATATLQPQRIGTTTGGGLGPASLPHLSLLLSDDAVSGNAFGNHVLIQPGADQTLAASAIVNESTFGAHTLVGGDDSTVTPTPEKERGPGGVKPRRRYLRVWDGEQWVEVHTIEAAQELIETVEAKAAQDAQEAAQRLAAIPKVRMRAARRAAPVVRVEAPQEDVAAIQRRVEETNARLREMYESALRAEMIGRLLQKRMEEDDEEDAILALLD